MKILIADDDPISCRLMQRMLERSGYEVVVASDGKEACEQLAKVNGPRLALIDWMMPELDGPGVCRIVRQMPDAAYIYIVLLTSKESSEDVVAGLEAGADDYLTKPCNPSELKARLLTGRRILELENKLIEARDSMRFRAMHDGLTNLLNRSSILSRLTEAIDLTKRAQRPFSILLCDIDFFKRINDQHGHLAGDAVLEHFASRLRHVVRTTDAIGRYGGEEFLILLNGCDSADLPARAEHIRRNIAEKPFGVPGHSIQVTTSVGGTTVNAYNLPATTEAAIDQADVALYRAKADGRNCARLASTLNHMVDPIAALLADIPHA